MAPKVKADRLDDRLRVKPGSKLDLRELDAGETFGFEKAPAAAEQAAREERLTELQDRLWAEAKRALLIILQGIDAAGKDGTIRHVMDAFNPQGCSVYGFKAPTPLELRHDFLWRIHERAPEKGTVGIFNRSHYEDVLIVRVHDLVPERVWRRRFDHINAWETMLTDEGTTILKFFLYIDKDEQGERLQARIDTPEKRWKFSAADLPERDRWDAYIDAFNEAISRTSTEPAPWYVIPANRKWFRNLAVAQILAEKLADLDPQYPPAEPGVEKIVVP